MTEDRLFTTRELALRWDVAPGTVLDWFEAGRLPGAIRLGGTPRGRLRWPEAAVEAIERAWTQPSSSPADATPGLRSVPVR